jgi:hypothetical protein
MTCAIARMCLLDKHASSIDCIGIRDGRESHVRLTSRPDLTSPVKRFVLLPLESNAVLLAAMSTGSNEHRS